MEVDNEMEIKTLQATHGPRVAEFDFLEQNRTCSHLLPFYVKRVITVRYRTIVTDSPDKDVTQSIR